MYTTLKKLLLKIAPKQLLLKNELALRSIYAFRYRGKNHLCPICKKGNKKFIKLPDGDDLCPFCGSRSRTRHLYSYISEQHLISGSILHFSPSRSLFRVLKKEPGIDYVTSDFEDEFMAQFKYDITAIPRPENSFDLIICYHILEHIPDDMAAMRELSRVLKSSGTCLIQTPFKEGEVYEDPTITTPGGRLEAFGQEDHVRIYSIEGLKERLLANGFTNITIVPVAAHAYLGVSASTVLIAKK